MDLSVGQAEHLGESMFVGIIRDLTERKRGEQELRETAARMKALVDTAIDGIMVIDPQGRVQMFNPACERLFGYQAGEVIGQNVKMLMPSPYREEHDGYLESFLRTGERKIIGIGREVSGLRRDGTDLPDGPLGRRGEAGRTVDVRRHHPRPDRAASTPRRS